jgi:hypothetical protein
VTDHLQLLLRKAGHHLHTTAEKEVVRTIKEKCCYIAVNPLKEEKDSTGRTEEFRLPDGNIIQVWIICLIGVDITRLSKYVAGFGAFSCARDFVQPRIDWTGVRRCAPGGCRLNQPS